MNRAFRIIKLILLVLGILLCLAIPVAGLASTAVNWHGICYGFTDGQSACTWWEFARNEMFWSSFLFIPLLFLASIAWLGMAAAQFIAEMIQKRKKLRDA
jgi:apolipoprotein N-acyltransferase